MLKSGYAYKRQKGFYRKNTQNVMIQEDLAKNKIIPDPLKDQFFLTDKNIVRKVVEFAKLEKSDVILEIGAGTGNLTEEIAKKVRKVIAFEIDERFNPFLSVLPKNVEVHYENAWNYVQMHGKFRHKKLYNKVVSNPPYSFIEPFLHNLTFLDYDKVILLVPNRFMKKTEKWGIFGAFFEPKVLMEVPKESFYPVPKTNSYIIDLIKLPDPVDSKNLGRFLRQYLYRHEEQLVKNSLMEGLIKYQKIIFNKMMTKNEARKTVSEKDIPEKLLEAKPGKAEIYETVEEKFNS
jgi:16S rRNA (adenine1518-N6/adenine1519-N6)-dimethyltransferase